MKPHLHAITSARKFGGKPEDYMDIHNMMDSTKSAMPDYRHRAIFHSSFGIFIIEKIFGDTRVNSAGKTYSVRDVAEQHVIEDLGRIPTLENWLIGLPVQKWMSKPSKIIDPPEEVLYDNAYVEEPDRENTYEKDQKDVLNRAILIVGGREAALKWYTNVEILSLGNKTAEYLVLDGKRSSVMAYLNMWTGLINKGNKQ